MTTIQLLVWYVTAKLGDGGTTNMCLHQKGKSEGNNWANALFKIESGATGIWIDVFAVIALVVGYTLYIGPKIGKPMPDYVLWALCVYQTTVLANNVSAYFGGPAPLGAAFAWVATKIKGLFNKVRGMFK
jgi:hypothetical protein